MRFPTITLIALLMLSCSENEEDYDYQYDGDIYFTFKYDSLNVYDDYEGILMYLRTEEIFSCYNYYIVIKEERKLNRIDIHILEVDIGSVCFYAFGPANKIIPMNFYLNEYELVFHNSNGSNTHNITILDDSIAVAVGDTSFTEYYPYGPLFWR